MKPTLYVEVVPESCTCHWRNYNEHDGWHLVEPDAACPVHADPIPEEDQ